MIYGPINFSLAVSLMDALNSSMPRYYGQSFIFDAHSIQLALLRIVCGAIFAVVCCKSPNCLAAIVGIFLFTIHGPPLGSFRHSVAIVAVATLDCIAVSIGSLSDRLAWRIQWQIARCLAHDPYNYCTHARRDTSIGQQHSGFSAANRTKLEYWSVPFVIVAMFTIWFGRISLARRHRWHHMQWCDW